MPSDVAKVQQAARIELSIGFLNQAARMLERVRDATPDPADRRVLDGLLERMASIAGRLAAGATLDPGHDEVDQATSFGAPADPS